MSRNIQRAVKLTCSKCRNDQFIQPSDPKPEDNVTCASCGTSYILSELQEASALREGEKLAEEFFRSALGKLGK